MKKILMNLLILLGLFNNINSMEKANNKIKKEIRKEERNLGELEALPNEIKYEIIKSVIEDNINSWNNIFNFDNESLKDDLDRVKLISKNFTVFEEEELNNLIKKLKEKKLEHLKKNIKDEYKGLSKEKLDKELTDLLNSPTLKSSIESLKECVRLIIAGANIDIKNKYGGTALIIAAETGQIKVVKLLIEMGAKINSQYNNGRTALMVAAWNSHIEVVRLLIEKGAKINIIDYDGYTALMLAQECGCNDIVELLRAADAQNSKGTIS